MNLTKLLFCLNPEAAHYVALKLLKCAYRFRLLRQSEEFNQPITVMGLPFKNNIGLAAGFDKNGEYIDALAALGFGFIEVGTVTPKPQPGNPKPRLFRIANQQAIINRMGFNNKGVDYLVEQLKQTKYRGVLGINIGKNRDTPISDAISDYVICFRKVAPYASYVVINISSPNTADLRSLQTPDALLPLLQTLKSERNKFHEMQNKYIPLVVKISPDLSEIELKNMAKIFLAEKIDGIIATNTTIQHDEMEQGGMSGKPLLQRATNVLNKMHQDTQGTIPLIASGGVFNEKDVQEKLQSGASLVQIYSGMIYCGPRLIKNLISSVFPL